MLSPGDELPDEVLFPTTEHPNTHEDGPSPACPSVSTCLKISEETDNKSGAQKEKVTENWNISRNELEDNVGSNRLAKWKLIVSNPAEEAINGGDDGGTPYQQTESETKAGGMNLLLSGSVTRLETGCDAHSPKLINLFGEGVELTVDSESMTETGKGQMSNNEHEKQDGLNVQWKGRFHREATMLNGKGSANKIRGIQLLGTNRNLSLERNLTLLPASMINKMFDCDTEGEKLVEKEENDFVYEVNTSEIKEVKHAPDSKNVEISIQCHGGSPTKIPLSFEREDHQESQGRAENTQKMKHQGENSLMQPEAKLVLGVNPGDNLERTRKQRINAGGIHKCMDDMMDTEPHFCSVVQLTEKQCETDHKEVCESPVRDTELRECGRDRDESVRPPVDRNECTSTGKDNLICKKALFYLLGFF